MTNDKKLLERIVLNPNIMVGKPVIRGTRLTVDFILNLLAHGASEKDILSEYKGLTTEDIQACYLFEHYVERLSDSFVVVTERQVRFAKK